LAIVGAGRLGRIHAKLASQLPEFEIVGVVDPQPEACRDVAAQTGASVYRHPRELFGAVDAVVIASPTAYHHELAADLLRGGVHALVEKPLTLTLEQADDLVRIARRRHVVLQTGHVERFNPALLSVEGRLQSPKYIEARRTSGYTFRSTDVGVVLDLMIHDIDLTLALTKSEVTHVEALGASVMGGHEDMASARLHFACGAVAQLTASRTSYEAERRMHVYTPRLFAALDFGTRRATVVEPRSDVASRRFDAAQLSPEEQDACRERLFDDVLKRQTLPAVELNAIEEELRDFARAIRFDVAPRVSGEAGRDAVAVAQQVLEAIEHHAWDGAGIFCGPNAMPPAGPIEDLVFSPDDTVVLRPKAA
ncbi:MAG: Gfo/Idh/MocA family oxidoreductase, partial [Planctomycetales bacterium]|nr:Gfo/Idh/MocA family oxidoreductase [Planctomycetales bacterium]